MTERLDLYWIPLGAGQNVVRISGKVYEALCALVQRRRRCDLYHSALIATTEAGRYTIEMTPIPGDGDPADRGVVAEGCVGSRWLRRFRVYRYEIRCWRDGVIPDLRYAVASPVHVSDDAEVVHRVLESAAQVPPLVWGRDEIHAGRCGTRTPSCRGCSPRLVSARQPARPPTTAGRRAGMPACWRHTPRCNTRATRDTDGVTEGATMADAKEQQIAELLHEAAETHHQVYRITDGTDDDWASWYADWLIELSELPQLLGKKPVRSHLVHALVQLDRDHTAASTGEPWPAFYARGLLELG
jgi:hypothetical protein